ncbi:MAG: PadR family transcriptional regulator [Pleurocapsa minor GSE-CHR-MK-17-07R]|jgi:DNA-binding PadR family transcriptional regulator|nr:PadR family transcriptional regulator [Pleurocapsa minor GSE-CHR-MK 17-07R]
MLKFILLGFLNYAPMTGYQIKTLIEDSTAHFWHAYHSQIYTTLRALEEQGLVSSEMDESDEKLQRRVYTLTEVGRQALLSWLNDAMMAPSTVKDELLVRVFFSGQRSAQSVREELLIQRRLHQQQLELYRAINLRGWTSEFETEPVGPVDLAHESKFWAATLKFGMRYEQLYLDWLDELLASL